MRQNGLGTLTLEDARTWIEETGLCLFLPHRQFSSSVAPSFVEAIAGRQDATPDPRQIAAAEELLVRLENDGVAVRLNLQGQPGEQPDFVVAAWVLPYVYALRGDRDWRRNPQLTGSRAVSQLAVQAYKLLEAGDSTIPQLKHTLGREVTEGAVLRAITELWQQLRIIPVVSAPGQPARWQLLRHRFQKAIAEGASTSQVTAISVLASIYLQAVIAASMEEVEVFLAPLTARSKVREVLRGLVATRQVHTISFGPAPHYYVAGTLPEFAPPSNFYAGSTLSASSYFGHFERGEDPLARPAYQPPAHRPPAPRQESRPAVSSAVSSAGSSSGSGETHRPAAEHSARKPMHKPAAAGSPAASRPHFSRPAASAARDRKPAGSGRPGQSANGSRTTRHGSDSRPSASRPSARPASRPTSRPASGSRAAAGSRWSKPASAGSNGKGTTQTNSRTGTRTNGTSLRPAGGKPKAGNSAAPAWKSSAATKHSGHSNGQANGHNPAAKTTGNGRKSPLARPAPDRKLDRKNVRTDARSAATTRSPRSGRKPAMTAGAGAGSSKRYGFTARPKQGTKKRG